MRNLPRRLGSVSLVAAGLLAASCAPAAAPGTSVVTATTLPATTTTTAPTTTITTTTSLPTTTTTATTLPPVTTSTIPPTTTTTLPAWWREATPTEPLRVWVIGDSLAGQTGSALAGLGRGTGVMVTVLDHQNGTGLASPGLFDWPGFAPDTLAAVSPDVVVVVLGANDGQGMASPAGWLEFGTAEWDARYSAVVGGFMDLLAADAARVYWVGVPIMAGPNYDARVRGINTVLRFQAALRLGVRYVDAYRLFQGPDGKYAADLPDENGDLVEVRAPDGIHFTPAGAQRMARRLMEILSTEWRLTGESGG